ncbi:MAG: 4-(cytidine 5'-diphospho)-2-C-methyl-D-erythritol kinase [Candidatus Limnocylindrales bacterium]
MIERLARAKVNLALAVVGRRADGYHELVSVFARLDLADRLSVEPAGDGDSLVVGGPIEYRPGVRDLVLRAAALVRASHAPDAAGLAFHLEKHIPMAAGLGGGSADGAAALDLTTRAWDVALTPDERLDLATRLGSDVPFMAADVDAALIRGRGEYIEPLPGPLDPVGILMVTSGAGLSTRDVFAAWDGLEAGHPTRRSAAGSGPETAERARALAAGLAVGWSAADVVSMATELRDANDLWPAASRLRPGLADLRSALEVHLGRPLVLSGSGPTLLALYPSGAAAETAATALTAVRISGLAAPAIRVATFARTAPREAP